MSTSAVTPLQVRSSTGVRTIAASAKTGISLADLLRREGMPLNTRCGERGLCDGCVVELVRGSLKHIGSGATVAAPAEVRGCEHTLCNGDAVAIDLPPRSVLAYQPQVVVDFSLNVPRAHDPLWQQVELSGASVAGGDNQALLDAVAQRRPTHLPVRVDDPSHPNARMQSNAPAPSNVGSSIAAGAARYATLEHRGDHWQVTGVSAARTAALGAAIDVGTTTVALLLVDLATGEIVGRASAFNRQMHLGDDVLTRIHRCDNDPAMRARMKHAIVAETIAPLLREARPQAQPSAGDVQCLTIAGNTTMLHLLIGEDPTPMGKVPFTPRFVHHRITPARDVGLNRTEHVANDATMHLLPSAAAYIGADITAGVLASALVYDQEPCLLVDVGTNGEIVLKHGDQLLGTATAAGPAFEGAGLTCGMRAGDGAIAHVRFTGPPFTVATELIGDAADLKPAGLCGSAYIDFLAEARQAGLLSPTGRFRADVFADGDDRLGADSGANRLLPNHGHGAALRVAWGQGKRAIVVSERDIASLLAAKAAIAAGILILLNRAGVKPADVARLYLAGGFGMNVNIHSAIACGLLPGFNAEQVRVVGNTALAGAYLALVDSGALDQMRQIARQIQMIELNLDPQFESCFIEQLSLP